MTRDVEGLAGRVLASVPDWIWDGEMLPVPVEDITDSCFNLHVRDVEDLSQAPGAPPLNPAQALSGLLLPATGEIWVNAGEAREWPHRRRFTIGHELGHWCMHRGDGGAVYCRSSAVAEQPEAAPPELPDTEREANAFAAALLMPARLVEREYERRRSEAGGGGKDDFWRLCETFGVSGAAMGRRLHAVI